MKVTTKKLEGGRMHFDCVASVEEVNSALSQASITFAQQMGLQPERGKTVAEVAEERMGIKDLDLVVENQAIEALVPFALDKKNAVPAFPPKAQPKTLLRRDKEFSFALDVLMKPDYELSSYEPVSFSIQKFELANKEELIDQQIAQMADSYTEYVTDPDATEVTSGASCKIAIEAKENGEVLPGLSTEGRTYTAGKGFMPEQFDAQVIGMKVGETKTFSFTGPDFDADGNESEMVVECTVTVLEMQKAQKPEVNDAWVAKYMPLYKSLEDMRESIGKSFEHQGREEYEAHKRQLAAAELGRRFQGRIEDEVYEAMRENLMKNLRQNLQEQGMTMEQLMEQNGGEQQFGMMMMMQTREMLVQGFALDALFRHEKMVLNDDDLLDACHNMNPQANPRQMRQQLEQTGRGFLLRETAERLKANKFLVEHADITYVEPQQPQA